MGNMLTFKEHHEQEELNELFGSLPFVINTLKWHVKNRREPKGEGVWRFKYSVPELPKNSTGSGFHYNDEGIFEYKGTYKKAIKALIKRMKELGGNVKQAQVELVA